MENSEAETVIDTIFESYRIKGMEGFDILENLDIELSLLIEVIDYFIIKSKNKDNSYNILHEIYSNLISKQAEIAIIKYKIIAIIEYYTTENNFVVFYEFRQIICEFNMLKPIIKFDEIERLSSLMKPKMTKVVSDCNRVLFWAQEMLKYIDEIQYFDILGWNNIEEDIF